MQGQYQRMKKMINHHVLRTGALALLLALGGCGGVSAGDPVAAPVPQSASAVSSSGQNAHLGLLEKIENDIGTAQCDNASQCKTLPIGHKACGGPEAYLAYSTKSGNSENLIGLGEQYAAARRAENERSGMMSTCMMVQDPGAACVANRCVLGTGGASVK